MEDLIITVTSHERHGVLNHWQLLFLLESFIYFLNISVTVPFYAESIRNQWIPHTKGQ